MPLDIMLDLETLGTKPGCAILQIGACAFDREKFSATHSLPFECTITTTSSEDAGFTASPATAAWWAMQPAAAREAVFNPDSSVPIDVALTAFQAWWAEIAVGADLVLWTQGNFDAPILAEALSKFNAPIPWQFWNVRDTRTAYDALLGPDGRKLIKNLPRMAPAHTALGDAMHQVACLKRAFEIGRNREGKWAS